MLSFALLLGCRPSGTAPDRAEWLAYRERFVTPEGRVVDTGNGGISHSEGQGYAMFLAVSFGDRAAFERIWRWTKETLQVRADKLFAWKWEPAESGGAVKD
ncbi:MAG: glycosyl hydrolase family 8, partial [Candidatus Binatia bacterium]